MITKLSIIASIIYAVIETLEKFGVKRKYAHLTSIPLGICGSFWVFGYQGIVTNIIYGIFIGLVAVGACDTLCNIVEVSKKNEK